MASVESTLLVVKDVNLFQIPPRQTSRGYRATDWDVNKHVFRGRLRIVSQGEKCSIKFEDTATNQMFAEVIYAMDGSAVEPVTDSSRYFVVKVVDPGSGRHAFLGLGFTERNDAFDFNVVLQDFVKISRQQKEAVNKPAAEQPKLDLGLKQGQTISINIANVSKKTRADPAPATNGGDPFFIPPPSSAGTAPKSSTPAPSGWVQF